MNEKFALKEAIEILNIDRGRMNEWLSRGLIDTEHEAQKGSRVHKAYSRLDIYAIAIFITLIEEGQVPRDTASGISKMWRSVALEDGIVREPLFFLRDSSGISILNPPLPSIEHKINGSPGVFNMSVLSNIACLGEETDWKIMFVLNIDRILSNVDARVDA